MYMCCKPWILHRAKQPLREEGDATAKKKASNQLHFLKNQQDTLDVLNNAESQFEIKTGRSQCQDVFASDLKKFILNESYFYMR